MINLTCLGHLGRFGNSMFQYALARAYCEQYDLELRTNKWLGQELFGLKEKEPDQELPKYEFNKFPKEKTDNIELIGFFQDKESLDLLRVNKLRSWFNIPREPVKSIVCHLRRGDFVGDPRVCVVTNDSYLLAIKRFQLTGPVHYVSDLKASDIVDDFLTMCNADVLLRATSSFSYWAGILNTNRVFSPDIDNKSGWRECKFIESRFLKYTDSRLYPGSNQTDMTIRE